MKTIFKIHILYYIIAGICIITGLFKDFIIISALTFIHEIGHITGAYLYKWKIDKVVILPFGGVTIFDENLNRPWIQEFVILILGPIFQIIFYEIIKYLNPNTHLLTTYHYSLLIFNFIPIIPLDGSKFLKLTLEKFLPFKLSYSIVIFFSFIIAIFILIISIIKINLTTILLLIFLFKEILNEYSKRNHRYNKFLLERYLFKLNFFKTKKIIGKKINNLKRDYKHIFYIENKWVTEKELLKKIFDSKRNL
ncbi:MAG: site-2 protease family protein [Bacilli bacterium]